jgi:predicted alpha/beta-hydrolase family hydrolase
MRIPGVRATSYDPPGEAVGTALLVPGSGYPPQAPLLFFTGFVLLQHGWRVEHHWWDPPDLEAAEDYTSWVCDEVAAALPASGPTLLVGKSLGSRAAPLAAERGLPAVWHTPLLGDPAVVEAIAANPAPQLLVGGTADPLWGGTAAARLAEQGCEVLEVPDADHVLMVEGDAVRGVEAHVTAMRAVDAWVAAR